MFLGMVVGFLFDGFTRWFVCFLDHGSFVSRQKWQGSLDIENLLGVSVMER